MSSTLDLLPALTTVTSGTLFYALDGSTDNSATADKIVSGGGGATIATTSAIDLTTWVGRYRFDSIAGSDGDAIASIANIGGGTADAAVQATGAAKPTLKTAGNGINGHNVARFDGGDSLVTTVGAAGMTGNMYMWAVFRLTSLTNGQAIISVGDPATDGKWRMLFKYGNFTDVAHNASFIARNADFSYSKPLTTSTVYLFEASVASGVASMWLNGAYLGSMTLSLVAFAATKLFIGCDPGSAQNLTGDIAECAFLGSARTQAIGTAVLDYCTNRYAITPLGGWGATNVARFNTAGQELAGSAISDNGTTVTVSGGFNVKSYVTEASIVNKFSGVNSLILQNLHSAGYSAVACMDNLTTEGTELALDFISNTFGYGNANSYALWAGVGYIETANFRGATLIPFQIVQTISSGGSSYRRLLVDASGNIIFNRRDTTYPSESAALVIKDNGDIVPGTAALATNATAGFLNLPTCAGTPTGVPTVYTGRVAMVYDTTAHKIWVYDGGAWKATAALS